MSLLKRKHRPTEIDRRRSLAAVPILHKDVVMEKTGDETVKVKIKVKRGGGWLSGMRPPVMMRNYKLDEFGTFVVQSIDHKRTVQQIVRAFSEHFGMTLRESELGVVAFLKMLMKRGMVSVGMSENGESASGSSASA